MQTRILVTVFPDVSLCFNSILLQVKRKEKSHDLKGPASCHWGASQWQLVSSRLLQTDPPGATTVVTSSSTGDKRKKEGKKTISNFEGNVDILTSDWVTKRRIFISFHSSQTTAQCRATRHELCLDLSWNHGKRANWACASHYSGMLGGDQVTPDCSSIRGWKRRRLLQNGANAGSWQEKVSLAESPPDPSTTGSNLFTTCSSNQRTETGTVHVLGFTLYYNSVSFCFHPPALKISFSAPRLQWSDKKPDGVFWGQMFCFQRNVKNKSAMRWDKGCAPAKSSSCFELAEYCDTMKRKVGSFVSPGFIDPEKRQNPFHFVYFHVVKTIHDILNTNKGRAWGSWSSEKWNGGLRGSLEFIHSVHMCFVALEKAFHCTV